MDCWTVEAFAVEEVDAMIGEDKSCLYVIKKAVYFLDGFKLMLYLLRLRLILFLQLERWE